MSPGDLVADGALWVAIPIAVLAGLVSFLSPCVLPLVPGYLGFIGGAVAPRPVPTRAGAIAPRAGGAPGAEPVSSRSRGYRVDAKRRIEMRSTTSAGEVVERVPQARDETPETDAPTRGRLLLGVLLFIAGFTVVFMSVNILGGTVGRFFLEYADPITRVMGVFIIVLGLVFIGLFGMAQRTFRPQLRSNIGLIGAPLLGIALGIGWTPCIGPTLTAIFSISWNLGDPGRGALLGLAYSLGLGIPFVLLTLGFGWATRSVAFLRRHIRTVNIIGGAMLVALGILMVSGIWTALMAQLQGVFLNVPLPL